MVANVDVGSIDAQVFPVCDQLASAKQRVSAKAIWRELGGSLALDEVTQAIKRWRGTRKLEKTVAFRLTTADYEEYKEKFGASGLSQSEFFRRYVLTNATTVMARNGPSPDYKNALRLLHAGGNNLNQIAHRMNSLHLEGKLNEASCSRVLAELQMLRAFMNGVIKDAD